MMALYSSQNCLDCHRVRFVLAEKGINVQIIQVEQDRAAAADMADLNPYNETPTLVDRDLVLYGSWVVTEYLDERYPHPPLMPVDPVSRSRLRMIMYRIFRDWIDSAKAIESSTSKKKVEASRRALREGVTSSNEMFELSEYLLHDELSLADCVVAPLLWRLPSYGIRLTKTSDAVQRYMERMFARDSFRRSLTDAERELR